MSSLGGGVNLGEQDTCEALFRNGQTLRAQPLEELFLAPVRLRYLVWGCGVWGILNLSPGDHKPKPYTLSSRHRRRVGLGEGRGAASSGCAPWCGGLGFGGWLYGLEVGVRGLGCGVRVYCLRLGCHSI